LRTRRIWVAIIVIVSWRATASSRTVESNARRVLPESTFDSAINVALRDWVGRSVGSEVWWSWLGGPVDAAGVK